MNDINHLIQRYLDGTTSLQEERLLAEMIDCCPDATAEQRALAEMLRCPTVHSEEDMQQWLTEDETAVYDNIMNHRRHRNILRWAAAAVVVSVVSLTLWLGIGSKGSDKEQPMTVMETTPALKANTVKPMAEISPSPSVPAPRLQQMGVKKTRKEPSSPKPVESSTSAMEGLQDALAMIETRLNKVADSVTKAQAEQVVLSDARLSRLYYDQQTISQ